MALFDDHPSVTAFLEVLTERTINGPPPLNGIPSYRDAYVAGYLKGMLHLLAQTYPEVGDYIANHTKTNLRIREGTV